MVAKRRLVIAALGVLTVLTKIPLRADELSLEPSALDARLAREDLWHDSGLMLHPYRPNYFMPYGHNFNHNVSGGELRNSDLKDVEAKFQISLRMPVATGLFWGHGIFQLAYTQLSLWQLYNRKVSSPFRETVYEPEAMITFDEHLYAAGWTVRLISVGLDHQSNGRSQPASRSWNRFYGQAIAARGNMMVSLKPWVRLPESSNDDDNPDIGRFMGNFEWRMAYAWGNRVGSVMWRNNLREHNKGAVELSYSFPMFRLVRGYLQYFNGYGESLIDYNHPSNRLSVGLAFTDWL